MRVRGHELAQMGDEELTIFRRRNIGFVFQNYNLVPMLTVSENIALPVELDGGTVDCTFMGQVVDMLELGDKLRAMPAELSGGQQQRVAIARALIAQPDVIFADEPTGNLDSKSGGEVMELLQSVGRKMGKALIVITHDDRIARMADRRFQIVDGILSEVTAQ